MFCPIEQRKPLSMILILHDWCSSVNRFVKVCNDLVNSGHRVCTLPFPGMGLEPVIWKRDIIDRYAGTVACYLKHNDVKCIIAHGMGCNVVLRALRLLCSTNKVWTGKLILVSPFYRGIRRTSLLYMLRRVVEVMWMEILGSYTYIKKFCKYFLSDELMVSDLRDADPAVAMQTLKEIVADKYGVDANMGRTFIICGANDKLVRRKLIREMASSLRVEEVVWMNCGHYPMAECYGEFMTVVRRFLDA